MCACSCVAFIKRNSILLATSTNKLALFRSQKPQLEFDQFCGNVHPRSSQSLFLIDMSQRYCTYWPIIYAVYSKESRIRLHVVHARWCSSTSRSCRVLLAEHCQHPVIIWGYPDHTGMGINWPGYSPDFNPCDFSP